MTAPALVVVDPLAAVAYGLDPGTRLPVNCWVVLPDGTEIRVGADGALTPRPTPAPWSKPSVAAIPTMVLR